MATLNTLQLGTFTNGNDTAITGTEPVLQEIASADDNTYVADTANTTHTGIARFTLENVNSDLGNMDTLSIRLRYANSNTPVNNTWDSLRAHVFKSDGVTGLAAGTTLSTPRVLVNNITATIPTNSAVIGFIAVDTAATKDDWDGAIVELHFVVTKSMAGDAIEERVFAAEITGTYTPSSNDVTGSAAATQGADTSAASGTFTPPVFTGTASPTQAGDTPAASGTFAGPTFTGSATPTQDADTSAASGTFTNPTLTGSAAVTQTDDTGAASGTYVPGTLTGSAAVTQQADTSTASGTFDPPLFTGSASPAQGDDTSAGSGVRWDYAVFRRTPQTGAVFDPDVATPLARTVPNLYTDVAPAEAAYDYQVFGWSGTWTSGSEVVQITVGPADSFTGTASPVQENNTSTTSGTFTNPTLTGSAAAAQQDETSTASGTFTAPVFTGSAASSQQDDTSTATGTFTVPTFTGSASATEADDTSTATGSFVAGTLTGSGSPVEADDTATASGTFVPGTLTGSAAVTQANQTSTASGSYVPGTITGSAAASQQADTSTASGTFTPPLFTGTLAAFQDAQTGLGMGTFAIPTRTGSAAAVQANQTSTATGVFTSNGPFLPVVVPGSLPSLVGVGSVGRIIVEGEL